MTDGFFFSLLILDKKVTNLPRASDIFSWINICFPCLDSLPYNLFLPRLSLSLISVARCQGKVPHRDSKSPLRSSAGLAPRQVCSCPQYQILSNILDAVGGPETSLSLVEIATHKQSYTRKTTKTANRPTTLTNSPFGKRLEVKKF